jgi:hypothetical protein
MTANDPALATGRYGCLKIPSGAAEYLFVKSMTKQFVSFNTFVSHQTLPYSSCDRFCTDQNDTAALFIDSMTLPSFAQNIPKPINTNNSKRKKC